MQGTLKASAHRPTHNFGDIDEFKLSGSKFIAFSKITHQRSRQH